MTRCWFVDDHRGDHDTALLCEFVELNRVTFDRWANPALLAEYLDDAYLANGIVDIFTVSRGTCGSPRVWGQLRRRGTTDLVVNALVMALTRRDPDSELVHHADHGGQYTSLEFSNRLDDWNINP